MVAIMFIICILLILFAFVGISEVGSNTDDALHLAKKLEMQIETLRIKIDAYSELYDSMNEEIDKANVRCEDMKRQLIEIQNAYVVAKRQNESIAHELARNGGVNWAKKYKTEEE